MSSAADDVVSTTIGMWQSSTSDLIFSNNCLPSYFGRFRSSRIRSGARRTFEGAAPIQKVQAFLAVAGNVQVVLDLVVLEGFPGDELVTGIVFDQQDVNGS